MIWFLSFACKLEFALGSCRIKEVCLISGSSPPYGMISTMLGLRFNRANRSNEAWGFVAILDLRLSWIKMLFHMEDHYHQAISAPAVKKARDYQSSSQRIKTVIKKSIVIRAKVTATSAWSGCLQRRGSYIGWRTAPTAQPMSGHPAAIQSRDLRAATIGRLDTPAEAAISRWTIAPWESVLIARRPQPLCGGVALEVPRLVCPLFLSLSVSMHFLY